MNIIYFLYIAVFYLLVRLLCPFRVIDKKNIPRHGPLMICANHTNLIDPVIIAIAFGFSRRIYFMAKAELFKIPILGCFLRSAGVYPVARDGSDVSAIKISMRHLRNGDAIMLFPEGRRVPMNETAEAKAGAVKMAIKTNTPILPVFLTPGRKIFRSTIIRIGQPFTPANPDNRDYDPLIKEMMKRIFALEPLK